MNSEDLICRHYEAAFAAIASLDGAYYRNPSPSRTDRLIYATRQEQLENLRTKFYAELAWAHQYDLRQPRRCRFLARKFRREPSSL
jgi:hypothetical protein